MRMEFEQIEFFSHNMNECNEQANTMLHGQQMRKVEYLVYEMTTSMATQSFRFRGICDVTGNDISFEFF